MGPPSSDLIRRLVTLAEFEPSQRRLIDLAEHMVKLKQKARDKVGASKLDAPSDLNTRLVHAIGCLIPRRVDWESALEGTSSWAAESVSIIEELVGSLRVSRWNWEKEVDVDWNGTVPTGALARAGRGSKDAVAARRPAALLLVFTKGGSMAGLEEPPEATRLVQLLLLASANPTVHTGAIVAEAARAGWANALRLLLESPQCAAGLTGIQPSQKLHSLLYREMKSAAHRLDLAVVEALLTNGVSAARPPFLAPPPASEGLLATAGALGAVVAADAPWCLRCQPWRGETVEDKLAEVAVARVAIIRLLIAHGADPAELDSSGVTPLEYSRRVESVGLPNDGFGKWSDYSVPSDSILADSRLLLPPTQLAQELELLERLYATTSSTGEGMSAVSGANGDAADVAGGAGLDGDDRRSSQRRDTGENTLPLLGSLPVLRTNQGKRQQGGQGRSPTPNRRGGARGRAPSTSPSSPTGQDTTQSPEPGAGEPSHQQPTVAVPDSAIARRIARGSMGEAALLGPEASGARKGVVGEDGGEGGESVDPPGGTGVSGVITVHISREATESMGMGIVTDLDDRAFIHTISRVTPGGVADRCGLLQGDQLIKLGETLLGQLAHPEILVMVKQAGQQFTILLQRPSGSPSATTATAPPASLGVDSGSSTATSTTIEGVRPLESQLEAPRGLEPSDIAGGSVAEELARVEPSDLPTDPTIVLAPEQSTATVAEPPREPAAPSPTNEAGVQVPKNGEDAVVLNDISVSGVNGGVDGTGEAPAPSELHDVSKELGSKTSGDGVGDGEVVPPTTSTARRGASVDSFSGFGSDDPPKSAETVRRGPSTASTFSGFGDDDDDPADAAQVAPLAMTTNSVSDAAGPNGASSGEGIPEERTVESESSETQVLSPNTKSKKRWFSSRGGRKGSAEAAEAAEGGGGATGRSAGGDSVLLSPEPTPADSKAPLSPVTTTLEFFNPKYARRQAK